MKQGSTGLDVLRDILANKGAGTQEELRAELEKHGFEVNQSTISRNLRKLRAVKIFNPNGEATYKLPDEQTLPTVETSMSDLITEIVTNDFLIVMHTHPGSASLIARNLDHFVPENILGTIAGDDTIFVAIPSGKSLKKVAQQLKEFFGKG
jgi:transcriptional regulator of arginine metabolism